MHSKISIVLSHDHVSIYDTLRRPLAIVDMNFMPFSGGRPRGRLGQKFALVELCCVVARIFSEFSVQLGLDERSSRRTWNKPTWRPVGKGQEERRTSAVCKG